MESIKPQLDKFDKFLSRYKFLVDIEKNSQIPKTYLVGALGVIVGLSIILDVFAELTVGLISLIYPLQIALKSLVKSDIKATKLWLLYFSLLSCWSFIEQGGLFPKVIPYYYALKTLVILWLITPTYLGINVAFEAIHPKLNAFFVQEKVPEKE